MEPANSVSVVDVKKNEHVTEIDTPGCALIYPMGPRRFAMLCGDGSLLTVNFTADGKAELSRGDGFFDAKNDPVFEHAAVSTTTSTTYYLSYSGKVYPTDMSGKQPKVQQSWSVTDAKAEADNWRPGGWMPITYHAPSDRLFVLMHQGEKWTHKHSGSEVWVFDATTHERLKRIKLEQSATSLLVTGDAEPLLYALKGSGSLAIYDVANGYSHTGTMDQLGDSPRVLYVHGK